MTTLRIDLEDDLAALLHQLNQPLDRSVREFVVLELYRRGLVSSGRGGELLGMSRIEFIRHASRLGIPYYDMTEDEWKRERSCSETL